MNPAQNALKCPRTKNGVADSRPGPSRRFAEVREGSNKPSHQDFLFSEPVLRRVRGRAPVKPSETMQRRQKRRAAIQQALDLYTAEPSREYVLKPNNTKGKIK